MSRPVRNWTAVVKGALGAVAALAVFYTFFMLGPALETRYYPVLGKMRITEVEPLSGTASLVRTEFEKLRGCEYMGIAWYYGPEAGVFERVGMVPIRDPDDTSSPNRPVGIARAGPWRIGIPANELRAKSYVQVWHRCHPFWTTMTDFYP